MKLKRGDSMEVNDIIVAISQKLQEVFGSDYEKYVEQLPEDVRTPCFLIQFQNLEQKQQIGKRWRITTLFNVQYFPQNGAVELANMSLKIQQALKEITLFNGSKLLSTGANSKPVEGILHNFMNFNFFLQEVEAKDFMESLEQHQPLKGDE